MCTFFDANIVSYERCNYWYKRFEGDNSDLSDRLRPGQPRKFEDVELQALLDEDSTQTQKAHANQLGVTQAAIYIRTFTHAGQYTESRTVRKGKEGMKLNKHNLGQ